MREKPLGLKKAARPDVTIFAQPNRWLAGSAMRGLRLTRVRGVPQCDGEEVEALFRLQCEGAARKRGLTRSLGPTPS